MIYGNIISSESGEDMVKVITYGTFDLMHYGHRKLLERAKALGDYLIVGVTSSDFDKARGKINVQQSLLERIAAIRETGLADKIIVEEYEGQKIDDIRRYEIDIFAVGSDWTGKFDYLREYCQVVYLPRTNGISSSELRSKNSTIRIGMVGSSDILKKFKNECGYVNGAKIVGICSENHKLKGLSPLFTNSYIELLENVDAVYVVSHPTLHVRQIESALSWGKHVICESPIAMDAEQCNRLFHLAQSKDLVLMDGIKTAYSMAYNRLLLIAKILGKLFQSTQHARSLCRPMYLYQSRGTAYVLGDRPQCYQFFRFLEQIIWKRELHLAS